MGSTSPSCGRYSTRAPRVLVGTAGGTGLCLVERRALRLRAQPLAHAPQPVWHDARQSTQRCSRATPSMQQCNMQRPELQHATWNGATVQRGNKHSATLAARHPTLACRPIRTAVTSRSKDHGGARRPLRLPWAPVHAVRCTNAPLHRCIRCIAAALQRCSVAALHPLPPVGLGLVVEHRLDPLVHLAHSLRVLAVPTSRLCTLHPKAPSSKAPKPKAPKALKP